MTEKELMLSEQLYIANDPELGADNQKARQSESKTAYLADQHSFNSFQRGQGADPGIFPGTAEKDRRKFLDRASIPLRLWLSHFSRGKFLRQL